MSNNRAARRASEARFRHEVSGTGLVTHLFDANTVLDRHPLLRDAVRYWQGSRAVRRPICISCKESLADPTTAVGAFLCATSPGAAGAASVSALCSDCWRDLSDDEIQRVSLRVFAKLVPHARFER